MNKIAKLILFIKDYLPFVKTTVSSAMSVFEKAQADLDRVRQHNVAMAKEAEQAELRAAAAKAKAKDEAIAAGRKYSQIAKILGE